MTTKLKHRYPGVNYFTEEDQDIFCGRQRDIQKLYTQILLSKTMVLHGESGTGKSSLIQAGLIPLLRNKNPQYLPITIRFEGNKQLKGGIDMPETRPDDILILEVINQIRQVVQYSETSLPFISSKEHDLWHQAKLAEKNGCYLFLIFDQFEELQTYTYRQIEVFKQKLSAVFSSSISVSVYEEIEQGSLGLLESSEKDKTLRARYNENLQFMEQPLNTRALFGIREDKLGTMSLLSDFFPDILKNDFLLLPLDMNGAREAIVEPARKKGNFHSRPFQFEENAIVYLLKSLADTNTNRVDPLQIQIICRNIERNVASKKELISDKDLPKIDDIINRFYDEIWTQIRKELSLSDKDYDKIRKSIIKDLVVNNKRNQVNKENLTQESRSAEILKKLTLHGLIREIPSGNETYCQLCHDRLITPVINDLRKLSLLEDFQKEKERESRFRTVFILVVLIFVTSFFLFQLWDQNKSLKNYRDALVLLKRGDSLFYRSESARIDTDSARAKILNQATVKILEEAITLYDSSIKLYPQYYGAREKLSITYIHLAALHPQQKYFDSLQSTYLKAVIQDSSVTFLFRKILSELDAQAQKMQDNNQSFEIMRSALIWNLVNNKIEKRSDLMLRELATDFYSLGGAGNDTMAFKLYNKLKVKLDEDYIQLAALRPDSSIGILKQCLASWPQSCRCNTYIAGQYTVVNQRELANRYAVAALRVDDACADVVIRELSSIEISDFILGFYDELISEMVNTLMKRSTESVSLIDEFARRLLSSNSKKHFSYAIKLSAHSIKLSKDCGPCWDTQAEIYWRQGKVERAERANNTSLRLYEKENMVNELALYRKSRIDSQKTTQVKRDP